MRNNEHRPVTLRGYARMWRGSRGRPLPCRMQYSTWLEWGQYDLDGRTWDWVVWPCCRFLDWAMSWWPHEHEWWRDAAHKPERCIWCDRSKP